MDLETFARTLPRALRFLRHKVNRTQEELAGKAGITPSMVSNYERGKEQPSLPTLIKLLQALESDLCDLNEAIHVLTEHWTPEAKEKRQQSTRALLYQLLEEKGDGL